jgi:hypothetical protein
MTRKLLPYEHQLVEELGITQEDYLAFLQVQFDYTTTPEQRLATPQAATATVALVLTIIGILAQVASMFLMPKPPGGGKRQPREQTFVPRLGFNSAQELAKYGDPINLVYTNTSHNANGGVRVATALIWSAIESFGSSQYMQMMLALGGGQINAIDAERMAFGQTPIRQFQTQNVWLYYNKNGNILFSNVVKGDINDPSRKGAAAGSLVYRVNPANGARSEGFSQAFSPTTLTKCGVFSPIPINVAVVDRSSSGKPKSAPIGITVDPAFLAAYWPTSGLRPVVPVGAVLVLTFAKAEFSESAKTDVIQTASEKRRSLLESLDLASTYMLGSAKFRLTSILNPDLEDLDTDPATASFTCVGAGRACKENYDVLDYRVDETVVADEIETLQNEITALQTQLTANPFIYTSADVEEELNAKLVQIQAKTDAYIDFVDNAIKLKTITDITPNSFYPLEINALIEAIDGNEERLEGLRDGSLSKGDGFGSKKEEIKFIKNAIKEQTKDLQQALFAFFDEETSLDSPTSKLRQKTLQAEINALNIEATKIAADTTIRDIAAEDARNAEWQASIDAKQAELLVLEGPGAVDNYYHTKCLVKIEEAAYESITQCNVIDFALRARVFQRISNRSRKYGEKKEEQFKNSDNGTKLRSSFFRMYYRRTGEAAFTPVNRIFVVRRGNDIDNYVSLKFTTNASSLKLQFQFRPIAETAAEMLNSGPVDFAYIDNEGTTQTINNGDGTAINFIGTLKSRVGDVAPLNNAPSEIDEWSLFSVRSDTQLQLSFDNGPEIEIKAVTEQSIESLATGYPDLYKNLSLIGFNAYSGQGIQDLRSITAFVTQGKRCTVLTGPSVYALSDASSSFAPDIFLDTITDTIDGIGRFSKIEGVDLDKLWLAKQFCSANGLFMDGVIAEQTPWRQFWAEVAPFSLLELGRIGGKETLVPAVPCNAAGVILSQVPISAMFTAGNILEDSYKEEYLDYGTNVQDLIATVIYRDTETDGVFPRNRSVDVKLAGVVEGAAVRQTFDLSQFVTLRNQAVMFAKLLCNQRRHIRKAIEFRTFPTDSVLSPGAYIYVDIGQAQWNNIFSGAVQADGALNTPIANVINGTYNVLLWKSGQSTVVSLSSVSIVNNTAAALAGYDGWLFVLGTSVRSKRVFRITEVQMDEEGEVSVKALEHPCDNAGNSLITVGLADPGSTAFTIR